MADYDWSKFTRRIAVHADAQKIYDAWTTPQGLESWFLRKAHYTKPGGGERDSNSHIEVKDIYMWQWHGYGDDVKETGEVISNNGKDQIQFTFAGCQVTVAVNNENGIAVAELTQENIPTDDANRARLHVGCMEGWTFYLANLKSVLEGGLDLRNKDSALKNVLNS